MSVTKEVVGWYSQGRYRLEIAREATFNSEHRADVVEGLRKGWKALDVCLAAEQFAFASECILKGLIVLEGNVPGRIHDIESLLGQLSAQRVTKIRQAFENECSLPFDATVQSLKEAMIQWRYTPMAPKGGGLSHEHANAFASVLGIFLWREVEAAKPAAAKEWAVTSKIRGEPSA